MKKWEPLTREMEKGFDRLKNSGSVAKEFKDEYASYLRMRARVPEMDDGMKRMFDSARSANAIYHERLSGSYSSMQQLAALEESKKCMSAIIRGGCTREYADYMESRRIMDMEFKVHTKEPASPVKQAEAIIDELEQEETRFTGDDRNLIVNYAFKINDMEKTKKLADAIYYGQDNGQAAIAVRNALREIEDAGDEKLDESLVSESLPSLEEMAMGL